MKLAMIFAKDMERMVSFYEKGCGLKPVKGRAADGWVEFDAGGARFAIHAIPEKIAATIEITCPPRPRSETPIKLVFGVTDLEEARTQLSRHGATMSEINRWGSCDGLDPEGNVFQISRS